MSIVMQFALDNLKELDGGKAVEALNQHIRRAALDCLDRPADGKPRTVTLTISLSPVLDPQGNCEEVQAQIHASSTVPKHRTKVYSLGLRRNGVLVFNPDSPDHIDQSTFLPANEDES